MTLRTQTVRIAQTDHAVLSELARKCGKPMAALLAEAIRAYQRSHLLKQTNEAYARLKKNPKAWQEETAERALWDNTLEDGLRDRME